MQKGILLEVEGRTGVVLTPKGEFKRVPLPQGALEVGDEIAFQESGSWRWGWVAAAAAVLLLVLSPFGYRQWAMAQPMALLMIDINPSLQLTLNGRQQVIAAEGLNLDGEAVLEGLTWKRRSLDEVTRAIAARAVAAGKLDPTAEGSAVVVAVAPLEGKSLAEEKAQEIVGRSRAAVHTEVTTQAEAKGQEPRTEVAVVEATADEVKQAREQGLTLPRLIILHEIQFEHPDVTAETIRSAPPAQILKDLGINPSELFSRAEQRHNSKGEADPASGRRQDGGVDADKPPKSNPGKGDDRRDEKGPKEKGPDKGDPRSEESGKPGNGSDKPGKGPDKPGNGDDKPGKGPDKPGNGDDKPGKGPDKPGNGDDKPGGGPDKPGNGNDKPGGGPDKPGNGPGKPPGSGPAKPGSGSNTPGNGRDKVESGGEREDDSQDSRVPEEKEDKEKEDKEKEDKEKEDKGKEDKGKEDKSTGKGQGPDGQGPPGQNKKENGNSKSNEGTKGRNKP